MSSGIVGRIKDIELEISRTQRNKATMSHLCKLKASLAKLRTQLLEPPKGSGGGPGEGFAVSRNGHARVALIGFPSVGKSSLLGHLTGTSSEVAAYEFTTLTCIPGNIEYKGTKIQMLDLPGIIEGAAHGKGRGREVIAVAKSSDVVVMVLDAAKEEGSNRHREILEKELETVGLRLNQAPPDISIDKKMTGGVKVAHTVPLTKLGIDPEKTIYQVLHEYKMHNAQIVVREDITIDQLIDVVEGNRKYVRCLYVYNKIDQITMEDVDRLARKENSTVISVHHNLGMERFLATLWDYLGLVRVYSKRPGAPPDLEEPIVLTAGRHGFTVEAVCKQVHRSLRDLFKVAIVWGRSTKHNPMHCGLKHKLCDEDVIQIQKKTAKEEKADADYGDRAQAHYEKIKARRKKAALKT